MEETVLATGKGDPGPSCPHTCPSIPRHAPGLWLSPHLSLLSPGTPLALKQLPKASTSLRGFLYEFCVGLSLGAHSAVVAAYGIGIESSNSYSFLMEPVLHGDLIALIQPKVGSPVPGSPRGPPRVSHKHPEQPGLGNHADCPGLTRPYYHHHPGATRSHETPPDLTGRHGVTLGLTGPPGSHQGPPI